MQATIELERLFRQDPDIQIVLVNDQNYFLFTPLLPQIASSYINPRHIVQPVRDIRGRRRFRFLRDDVRAIDLNARRVGLASEMHDFFYHYVAGRYRGIAPGELRLVVLEAEPEVLRGVHPKLAANALKRLQVEGIEIRLNAKATQCLAGGVEVNGKEIIPADTVIWTAGVRAHELIEALTGPHDRIGRAVVNEHLQLVGHPEVFVVGDSAAAVSAPETPRVAPVAISHGRLAGRNIAHAERGQALEGFRYVSEGTLVSLGMNHAVVEFAGLKFSGYFAWLFWNAVHLYKLVGLKKQLQVAIDWMLAVIFPRDASIVRRPRRCKFCGTDRSP